MVQRYGSMRVGGCQMARAEWPTIDDSLHDLLDFHFLCYDWAHDLRLSISIMLQIAGSDALHLV